MSDTNPYVVTELAGPKVAGRKVQPGDVLHLTKLEAEYDERLGAIKPAPTAKEATAKPAKTPDGKGEK